MGGGMPISACVAPASIMNNWGESRGEALHTSTFLGHPLACAAAIATIGVMADLDLPRQARVSGRRLVERLDEIAAEYPRLVSGVRGRGLMLGMQMGSPEFALLTVKNALKRGLILLPAGDDGSVIEFVPPLTITKSEIARCAAILHRTLGDLVKSSH